ncbi:MAG: hypothetical protein P4L36_10695 [Holophaga sp.]|nr:hypothetical protein [Holophaga sp.]
MTAGLASHGPEVQRAAAQLGQIRGIGANYQFETGEVVFLVCDYVPGRSLAQVLDKVREEQVPLGVDHALSVLHAMAQTVIEMHNKGLHHGAISPQSAWVSYEGAIHILDAPVGAVLQDLLPNAPALETALLPYRQTGEASASQQDLFALGAVFFELLTLEKLPTGSAIPEALAHATLKAANEEGGIPEQILDFLKRLLLVSQPFGSAAEFSSTMQQVLYDGDYSPTTFNMAFLMHTLFREENESDLQAMKQDQGSNYAPPLPMRGGNQDLPRPASSGRGLRYGLIAGAVAVAALLGGVFYKFQQAEVEFRSVQNKLLAFQRDKEAAEVKLADLIKQEEAQKAMEAKFGKQAQEATTQEGRAKALKDLEAVRQKSNDLAKRRAEALREQQKLAQRAQSLHAPATQAPPPVAPPTPPPTPTATPAPAPPPSAPVLDAQPTVIHPGNPQIPTVARESLPVDLRDTDIKVSVKVFVDDVGRPMKAVVLKGVTGGFNESAKNAALASTCAPGRKNGKPVSGWLNMEFNFGKAR